MDEVADEAGISKPMVYTYLGSKEDLFTACIRRETTRLMRAIAAGAHGSPTPDQALWRGLLAFFDHVNADRDSWLVLHRQARTQGGPFAAELADMRLRVIELVTGLLVGRSMDRTTGTSEPEALAAALVGAAESMADWWLDNPHTGPAESMAHRLMNLVWMGFGDLVDGHRWEPRD
jgi:AcrR family transcriptional regulator